MDLSSIAIIIDLVVGLFTFTPTPKRPPDPPAAVQPTDCEVKTEPRAPQCDSASGATPPK